MPTGNGDIQNNPLKTIQLVMCTVHINSIKPQIELNSECLILCLIVYIKKIYMGISYM